RCWDVRALQFGLSSGVILFFQVATTCEEPSGQVYVVRGKLAKSLRRARNRRGRFTSCEKGWPSRYDVRGTVGAGLRRTRKKRDLDQIKHLHIIVNESHLGAREKHTFVSKMNLWTLS
nr:hypothetical protein [Tanacetum cinerariifolium]